MYWTRWNSPSTVVGGPGLGGKSGWSCVGFHGVQALPSSSTPTGFPPLVPLALKPLSGLTVKPAPVDTEPGPCANARSPCGELVLDRTMCVWSSKMKRLLGGANSSRASSSNISSAFTLKNRLPKTWFMAMNEAAIPPELSRKRRRVTPSFFAAWSASSLTRSSTCFCFCVCGNGMYSQTQKQKQVEERSEEHTSELQSRQYLVCRLLLEKKKM